MSDHVWEDQIEPAFDAALWVLDQLCNVLDELDNTGCGVFDELDSATKKVMKLKAKLVGIKGACGDRRTEYR